jgi:hypothetical protein
MVTTMIIRIIKKLLDWVDSITERIDRVLQEQKKLDEVFEANANEAWKNYRKSKLDREARWIRNKSKIEATTKEKIRVLELVWLNLKCRYEELADSPELQDLIYGELKYFHARLVAMYALHEKSVNYNE